MLGQIKTPIALAGVSAGIMYLFDPDLGRRRRSILRDKMTHARNKLRKAADISVRDMKHRIYGTYCEMRAKIRGRDTSDGIVVDRIRSKIGRYTSHPSSIEVHVGDGHVTLNGPVLAGEVTSLLAAVQSVDGVRDVENLLEVHESPENIAALQGGVHRTGEPREWMQIKWSPTARLVAGTTGSLWMVNCLARRTPSAIMFGTAGFCLFLRAITNEPFARLAGIGADGSGAAGQTLAKSSNVPVGSNVPLSGAEQAVDLSRPIQSTSRRSVDDGIDESLMESFPASDAPSFTRR